MGGGGISYAHPVDAFREAVWEQVPGNARPERWEARRAFLLEHVRPGDRVLDLGCGDGAFGAAMLDAGAQVVAVDVSCAAVKRARDRAPGLDARAIAEDAPLPLPEDAFDVVWAGEVLEHALDTALLVSEIRRVLRFGGTLLVTTPANGGLRTALLALRPRAFDAEFDPRADHLRFYTSRTLREVLQDAGFPEVDLQVTGGPPLLRRALHAVAR